MERGSPTGGPSATPAETALSAFTASAAPVVGNVKVQYPKGGATLPSSVVQQLQGLDAQRLQISEAHMTTLRAGMTAARFQQFYNFAWGTEGPRIRRIQPGAKPPAGAHPPAKPVASN